MKQSKSTHQEYEKLGSKEFIKSRRSQSQTQKHKQFKNMALAQKRIQQMQILNNNIKRKLSLYNNLHSGPDNTGKNITQRPQPSSVPHIYESPMKVKGQNKNEKFTNYERNVIENYRQKVEQRERQRYSNPFEIALVEMIEKEQEMVLKRKKDMEFWKSKVRNLQLVYHQLNQVRLKDNQDI